jgi:hypothetical protein
MQSVLTDLNAQLNDNPEADPDPDSHHNPECFGWIKCGKKKMYKGTEIWEIPKNTVLYKGIKQEIGQNRQYYSDPYYVPGQVYKLGVIDNAYPKNEDTSNFLTGSDPRKNTGSNNTYNYKILTSQEDKEKNFIFLADNLSTAAYYAKGDDGRIISFITSSKIRLLNFSNINTLKYIYDRSSDILKEALTVAFRIYTTPNFISRGRSSYKAKDYDLLNLIKESFLWVDGYAYEQNSYGFNFHEEIAIFRPSLVLKRYPSEFRPTGIQVFNLVYRNSGLNNVYYPAEIWLKTFDGHYLEPILIPYWENSITRRYSYVRVPHDFRDNFILDPRVNLQDLMNFLKTTDFYQLHKLEDHFKIIKNFIYDN